MILLDSVTKRYTGDARPALDDVSLHIEPNEFVFLVGKSGAGKSTLIKMLTKEETPDSGKIVIGGIDLDYVKKRHIPGYRRRLGVVFQDFKLLPMRTVYENVAFALEIIGMSGKEIRKTVPKVLELVDLSGQAKKFPHQLSGGQKQRVSIARSVARQPKILIADEPTGQLDKLTTEEIIDLLRKINDFGTTILVTTHNEGIVNNLQKRVVTLKDGRIVNDQKNNGVYQLDAAPVEKVPSVRLQAPGHALKLRSVPKVSNVSSVLKVSSAPKVSSVPSALKASSAPKVSEKKILRNDVGSFLDFEDSVEETNELPDLINTVTKKEVEAKKPLNSRTSVKKPVERAPLTRTVSKSAEKTPLARTVSKSAAKAETKTSARPKKMATRTVASKVAEAKSVTSPVKLGGRFSLDDDDVSEELLNDLIQTPVLSNSMNPPKVTKPREVRITTSGAIEMAVSDRQERHVARRRRAATRSHVI